MFVLYPLYNYYIAVKMLTVILTLLTIIPMILEK